MFQPVVSDLKRDSWYQTSPHLLLLQDDVDALVLRHLRERRARHVGVCADVVLVC